MKFNKVFRLPGSMDKSFQLNFRTDSIRKCCGVNWFYYLFSQIKNFSSENRCRNNIDQYCPIMPNQAIFYGF